MIVVVVGIVLLMVQPVPLPGWVGNLSSVALASGGGTFTVNSSADPGTLGDSYLTLNEAMSVANGSLTGPFSLAERTQLAGCTFNGSGIITSGCGAGNDTIQFAPSLTAVNLNGRPPAINKSGVTINGAVTSGSVVIDAQNISDWGFNIAADNVTIENITVVNIASFGAAVALANGSWKGLEVSNTHLGALPTSTSCSGPGLTVGPYLAIVLYGGSGSGALGDGTAYITDSVIACSRNDGIALANSPYVYIGVTKSGSPGGNWIGTDAGGDNLGNSGPGISVCCLANSRGNQIVNNDIGQNGAEGVYVNATDDSSANVISANNIHDNSKGAGIHAGILISDSGQNVLNNNLIHNNPNAGIWFTGSHSSANALSGGTIHDNGGAGIVEGESAWNNEWTQMGVYNNGGLGIDKFDNGTPDPPPLSIDSVSKSGSVVTVHGNYSGTVYLVTNYQVDLYRLAADPSGYGEGRSWVGATSFTWNYLNDYHWSIDDPSGSPGCYTAVVTTTDISGTFNSSEFSSDFYCRAELPLILR